MILNILHYFGINEKYNFYKNTFFRDKNVNVYKAFNDELREFMLCFKSSAIILVIYNFICYKYDMGL